jgi:RNA polymerase sigma-70 factor (ECF subfamily)
MLPPNEWMVSVNGQLPSTCQPVNLEPDKFIPTRRSLLSRLKDWENQDSWQDFFDTYWRLIYDVARKAGLDDNLAQDVVQETILSVANQMKGFRYDPALGSFKSWLLQITRRRIADQLRRRYRSGAAAALNIEDPVIAALINDSTTDASSALEAWWDLEWREHITEAALQRVKGQIRAEQFQMFEFAVLKHWPATKVAQALGCSLTQVYMARHRVGKLLKKEIRRLEQKMI